ncbi:MAG: hypothetical protein CVU71_12550 [Deltaproteobacteria bacterium HGW-Deltaproteobacteria-6]|jgi:hypothetical protein|nr:MAG: hypothetical protein CVU71_12550 [Deltaproteobacteria bacterium HGW-Deltaproteobacteria-6]
MKKVFPVIFLPFLIVFLVATPLIASSDWVEHYTDESGDVISYKIENKIKNVVQVWVKRVLTEEGEKIFIQDSRQNGLPTEGWRRLEHFTSLYEIDCQAKSGRVLSVVIYDKEGKVVYAASFGEPKWEYMVPDSIGDSFRKEVCN